MTTAILIALCVGSFAMWLLMRERTRTAEDAADYYQALYHAANTPRVAPEADEVWQEFLKEQWR
jgi:hypothetical protein